MLKPVSLGGAGGACPGLGPPGAARDKALGAGEEPGCFALGSSEHDGHVPGGQGQVGSALCPHSSCLPPGQALHLRKVPRCVRGAEPHQDAVGAGNRAAEGAPAPRHGCAAGEGGAAQQRGRVRCARGRPGVRKGAGERPGCAQEGGREAQGVRLGPSTSSSLCHWPRGFLLLPSVPFL